MLRALESHCARQADASGTGFAVLEGTVIKASVAAVQSGKGQASSRQAPPRVQVEVRLHAGAVSALAISRTAAQCRRSAMWQPEDTMKVRLRSVDTRRGKVEVELLDP